AGATGTVILWSVANDRAERRFSTSGPINALAFTRDGKRLVTAGGGGIAILDLTLDQKPLPKGFNLTEEKLQSLWADLESAEPGKVYAAMRLLRADPARCIPFIRTHLVAKETVDDKTIAQLIADLDAAEFTIREAASRALDKLGKQAEAALRRALEAK